MRGYHDTGFSTSTQVPHLDTGFSTSTQVFPPRHRFFHLDTGSPPRHRFFHLDTGFSTSTQVFPYLDTGLFFWFPCVYKRMLRWFPKFPSCYYMPLMWPSKLKFSSYFFLYLCTCKITTATG